LVPITGYPEELKGNSNVVKVKNLKTGQEFIFPEVSDSSYVDYNFNSPVLSKIYYGDYIWKTEEGESHFSPHVWDLSAFVFKNNKFVRDEIWNNGKVLRTTEKIPVDDFGFQEIKKLFESSGANGLLDPGSL